MRKLSPKFEEFLFWLVISLLIFIPLYQKFPLLEFKGLPVAIRLEDFLVLATVIVWLVYIFISGKIKTLLTNRIFQAVLLFGLSVWLLHFPPSPLFRVSPDWRLFSFLLQGGQSQTFVGRSVILVYS